MMSIKKIILLGVVCLFALAKAQSQEDWTIKKEKNQVKVYLKDYPGSDYKQYRAVTEVSLSIDKVYNFIMNADKLKHWNHKVSDSKELFKEGDVTVILLYHDFPWPVKDRYNISHMTTSRDADGSIRMKISPDDTQEHFPEDDRVQMTDYDGQWILVPTENGTRITQEMWGDPAGNLPAWAVNGKLVENPLKTFTAMRELLEQ